MGRTQAPTERDRYWLDHEAALAASGGTAKAYAAEHDVSLHALYQARKRLRASGLLPAGAGKTRRPHQNRSPQPVAFSKVAFRPPPASPAEFRLLLPNGFVLEWSGGELPPAVVGLVERLTSPR